MDSKDLNKSGDQAIIIRVADFQELINQVRQSEEKLSEVHRNMLALQDGIKDELQQIKDVLPLKRRKMSAATKRAHIECILRKHGGMCPCCREVQIIDPSGRLLPACQEEHFMNRHENALDKTWLVCRDCNLKKTQGKLDHIDVEAFFKAYQATLRKQIAEKAGRQPYQMTIGDMLKVKGGSPGKSTARPS